MVSAETFLHNDVHNGMVSGTSVPVSCDDCCCVVSTLFDIGSCIGDDRGADNELVVVHGCV